MSDFKLKAASDKIRSKLVMNGNHKAWSLLINGGLE